MFVLIFLGKYFTGGPDPSGIVLLAFVTMELGQGKYMAITYSIFSLEVAVKTVR